VASLAHAIDGDRLLHACRDWRGRLVLFAEVDVLMFVEPRELLAVTASFDHDLVDGAPAARFARRLGKIVEGAGALRDRPRVPPAGGCATTPGPSSEPAAARKGGRPSEPRGPLGRPVWLPRHDSNMRPGD
jgi:hypothetical protein